MAEKLEDWVSTVTKQVEGKSVSWLSGFFFFRDPVRPIYHDRNYFFSPADGIILYQEVVRPEESLIEVKGKSYTLQEALQDPQYNKEA